MSTQAPESPAEMQVSTNPFPGLRPFEFDESHLFFGRDGQSEQLIGKLSRRHFLAVVGTSGSGKSSLVRAGFLPALQGGFMTSAGSAWRVAILRPGNDPIGNLARALNARDVFGSELEENATIQTAIAESTLRRGSLGLVHSVRQSVMVQDENLLVVVDQFEEVFRFARVTEGEEYGNEAAAFIKLLLEASAQREVPIYVVLTMRSDYLGDCSQFWGLPEAINESQYLIPRLTRDQLREAITGPVAVGGGKITPRLVNRLLNDVGDNQDQLPVLQHLLMRAWNEWKEQRLEIELSEGDGLVKRKHKDVHQGEAIDLCCADAVGGMTHALSRHADEAYNELPDDRHREVAEKLFKALTEKGPDNREIRRPITLGEICTVTAAGKDEVITVIETFRQPGRSFLMPPADVALNSESLVDISHESLIRGWARLTNWVDEEVRSARIYRRLAETAELNREGKAGLWGDPDLQLALDWQEKNKPNQEWAQRYYPHFETAMDFLKASEKKRHDDVADRERQHQAEMERANRDLEQVQALAEAQQQRAEAQRQKAEEQQQRLEQQAKATSRLRRLLGALVIVVLLACASAVFAFSAYKKADSAGREATTQKTNAIREKENAIAAALEADRQKRLALDASKAALVASEEAEKQKLIALQEKENAIAAAVKAEEQTLIAEEQRKQADDAAGRLKAEALKGLALSALKDGEPAEALTQFTKLREIYNTRRDPAGESYALANMADIHKDRVPLDAFAADFGLDSGALEGAEGDPAEYAAAAKLSSQMMTRYMALEQDPRDEKTVLAELSKDLEQAFAYYNQAVATNRRNPNADQPFREAGILKNLGDLQVGRSALDLAVREAPGEKAAEKEIEENVARGIQYYLEARAAYGKAKRPLEEAKVLRRIADLLDRRRSRMATSNPGDPTPAAGSQPTDMREKTAALERIVGFYEEANDAFRRANSPLKQASVLVRVGDMYKDLPNEFPEKERSAILYYERAREIYGTQKNFQKEGILSEKLAQLHGELSDDKEEIASYKDAFAAYLKASPAERKSSSDAFVKAEKMLKTVGEKSSRKEDANQFFEEAISRSGNDSTIKAQILSAIGDFYKDKDDLAEALKYYGLKLKTWRDAGNLLEKGNTLVEIGSIHNESKNIAAAFEVFDEARRVYQQVVANAQNAPRAAVRIQSSVNLIKMAAIYAVHDKQKAIAAYEEALQIETTGQYYYSMPQILQGEGRLLLELKTDEGKMKAEQLFQKALEFNRIRKFTDGEANTFAAIGDLYKGVGDKVEARAYYERSRIAWAGAASKSDYSYAFRMKDVIKEIWELEVEANPGKTLLDYYLSLAESAGLANDFVTQGAALEMYADSFRGPTQDRRKAVDYFERARLAYQRAGLKSYQIAMIRNLANLYLGLGEKQKAQELNKEADALARAPK